MLLNLSGKVAKYELKLIYKLQKKKKSGITVVWKQLEHTYWPKHTTN